MKDKRMNTYISKLFYLTILSLIITGTSLRSSSESSIANDSVEIQFKGIFYDNNIKNATQFEQFTKYKQLAQLGKLPFQTTPEEIDAWYEFTSLPRSYPVEYVFYKKGESYKKQIYCPSGTLRPWESFQEFVVNGNNVFTLLHSPKTIHVSDDDQSLDFVYQFMFDPILLLFPVKFNRHDVNQERMNEYQTIHQYSFSSKDHLEHSLKHLYDSRNNNLPLKSLLVTNNFKQGVRYIWYVAVDEYIMSNDRLVPHKISIVHCNQSINIEDEDLKLNGIKFISKYAAIDLDYFSDISNVENYIYRCDLDVESISFENISNDIFWPQVPENYSFKDGRQRIQALLTTNDINNKGEILIKGFGPYKFPK